MQREYYKWFSGSLQRDMELLVFGHAGKKVIVIPTREGRFYDYENFRVTATLAGRIDNGDIQLYCVDSVDSEALYCWGCSPQQRMARQIAYEKYLLNEVLPFADELNPDPRVVAHGCSFGAYHAVTAALRHPGKFCQAIAFSGRYDLTRPAGCYPDLFQGYYDDDVYYLTPNHFMPNLSDERILCKMRRMRIILAVGEDDPFLFSNQDLARTFADKQIPHEIYIWRGEAHRFRDWRAMADIYIV